MTSNRSAPQSASAQTPRDALVALARETSRIQIAAFSAAGSAVAAWARASGRLAQMVADEFVRRIDGESDSRELVVRVASATSIHVRELTTLPSTAADNFNRRLK